MTTEETPKIEIATHLPGEEPTEEPAEARQEAAESADETPTFATMSDLDKSVYFADMALQTLSGNEQNNPVLWIWAPVGTEAEVFALWEKAMNPYWEAAQPPEEMRPTYFPAIKEHPECRIPNILQYNRHLHHQLEQYARNIARQAGVDYDKLDVEVQIDTPALKAFYLMWNLGGPALQKLWVSQARKQLEEQAATVAKPAPKKLLIPR